MKVALVYDRVNKWGGAERVLLALKKIFPDAPLYTSIYDSHKAQWAKGFSVRTSFLSKFPFTKKHELLAPLMPIAFEQFNFDAYDIVISITSEAAKGILTKPQTKHICLCLTPTRYLWSGYEEYFGSGLFRLLTTPLVSYLRLWDRAAAARPDIFVAISDEVKKRIKTYYNRNAEIVYPPLDGTFLTEEKNNDTQKVLAKFHVEHDGYFLVVSRLSKFTAYKKVDHAIAAANALNLRLVVAGDGDVEYFKRLAGPTVTFTGKVSDGELHALYAQCKALIFPAKEDFGLVMAEVQACGKPVIAYAKGGAAEIVRNGKTGILYEEQKVKMLINALKNFDEKDYNSLDCKKNAERFSFSQFEKDIRSLVANV